MCQAYVCLATLGISQWSPILNRFRFWDLGLRVLGLEGLGLKLWTGVRGLDLSFSVKEGPEASWIGVFAGIISDFPGDPHGTDQLYLLLVHRGHHLCQRSRYTCIQMCGYAAPYGSPSCHSVNVLNPKNLKP